MANTYRVTVTFQGLAVLEIEAASPEAARLAAQELTLADLARSGQSDVISLKSAAREIVPVPGRAEADQAEEEAPRKPRPSGWYRPL